MKIQLHSSYLFVEIIEIDKTNVKHHPNEPINLSVEIQFSPIFLPLLSIQ